MKIKTSVYRPAPGAQFNATDAQIIGRTLERLGEFAPKDVVDAARPVSSPIHKFFEWNDSIAAEKFRLFQARNMVNHVQIVIRRPDGEEEPTKAFHSIRMMPDDDEGLIEAKYVSIRVVSSREDDRKQVIANALRELQGWKERYAQYRAIFSGVFTAIEEVKSKAERSRNGKRNKEEVKRKDRGGSDRRSKRGRVAAAANQ